MKNVYSAEELKSFAARLITATGVSIQNANIVADVLVSAELEGVASHGLTRLSIYIKRLQNGLINKEPNISLKYFYPSIGMMDADNALGHIAAYKAMEEAIRNAEKMGVAIIGVKHSNHFGAAGYFSNMALEKGFIGIVISNGPPAIPPWGGKEPYYGTNPFAISIPGGTMGDITIDMATSNVARGKIIKAAKEGKSIELGWALDKDGKPTTNAKAALEGCILPMGGPKGAAISMTIEILAGVLTGSGFGKDVIWQYSDSPEPSNVGHMFIAINPKGFINTEQLSIRMDRFIKEVKELPKAYGFDEIRIPGERKRKLREFKMEQGIELNKQLIEELKMLANQLNVPFPLKYNT